MKKDSADITIVLDRSGSMESVRNSTIEGFNTFIEEQRKVPGEGFVSLVQFDNEYTPLYAAVALEVVPKLTRETFVPRALTALLDAIGRTIISTGLRLSAMPESARPDKVLFVIMTDGGENASKEFTREKVFEMITHQRQVYSWDFVFIGANQDAIGVAASVGIPRGSAIKYAANDAGTQCAFDSINSYATQSRSVGSASFTEADRDAQKKAGA